MSESLAAIFHGAGKNLELRRVSTPRPVATEMVVRVLGCTVCGSDLHSFDGRRDVAVPTVLGHEIVGEIICCGDSAPEVDLSGQVLKVGDRVTWAIVASCGDCFYCRRDLPQKCLASVKYGHELLSPGRELLGGMAEHCLLTAGTSIVRLPDQLSLEAACPASCATATIAAAMKVAGDVRDRSVCLFGMGLLGLTATAMMKVAGAADIVCVDVDSSRLANAEAFGATSVAHPDELPAVGKSITGEHGFDVALELSGSSSAVESGWNMMRIGGTLVLVGSVFPGPPVSMAPERIVRRNLTIRGIHNYCPKDLVNAVEFLAAHHQEFPFDDLVKQWFSLEDAERAFSMSSDPGNIRVGIRPAH
ncbi:MAG TPA: alcohol dehydrogenase [Planctomycetes bacterium]|nr:alcohol dehydrogenase [Planctomycetota bacterium]